MAPPEPSTARRVMGSWRLWLPLLAVFLLAPPLLLWPMPQVGRRALLSAPQGEAAGHVWALKAALTERQPLSFDTEQICWPQGVQSLLIDPGNLPFFALGDLLGPAAGYNAIFLFGLLSMGLAGALLARRAGGAPWLGALAAMCCPAFLAGTIRGATEQLSVGWVGVAAALLLDALKRGGWRRCALAAVATGFCAWCGPYNGIWIAAIGLALGLWQLARQPALALRRALPVGLGAALAAAPVAWAVLTGFSVMNDPRFAHPPQQSPLEIFRYPRGGNIGYADLLDPWLPAPFTGPFSELSQTTYLGLVTILAAAAALLLPLSRKRWRWRWPWAAGALAASLVALGPWLYLNGKLLRLGATALPGPALLLSKLPMLGSITHWYRAAPVAGLLLAALVSTWGRRRWSPLLALTLLADSLLLAPFPWPHRAAEFPARELAEHLQGEGAILELPWTTQGDPPPGHWRNIGGLHQVSHGHPISSTVMMLRPATEQRLEAAVVRRLQIRGQLPASDRQRLLDRGFRWLVVYPAYTPRQAAPLRRADFEACFGPALAAEPEAWLFDLRTQGEACTYSEVSGTRN